VVHSSDESEEHLLPGAPPSTKGSRDSDSEEGSGELREAGAGATAKKQLGKRVSQVPGGKRASEVQGKKRASQVAGGKRASGGPDKRASQSPEKRPSQSPDKRASGVTRTSANRSGGKDKRYSKILGDGTTPCQCHGSGPIWASGSGIGFGIAKGPDHFINYN